MSSYVGLVYFQSLVGLRLLLASGVSYELGVNGEKKLMVARILLIKMGAWKYSQFKRSNLNYVLTPLP